MSPAQRAASSMSTEELAQAEIALKKHKTNMATVSFISCVFAGAIVAIFYIIYTGKGEAKSTDSWPVTGDQTIDQAHQQLNNITVNKQLSETTIVSAIRLLFYKPVFWDIATEPDTGKAMFAFCRADVLLEAYVKYFFVTRCAT